MRIKIKRIPMLSQIPFIDPAIANTPIDRLFETPLGKSQGVFFKLRRIYRPVLHK